MKITDNSKIGSSKEVKKKSAANTLDTGGASFASMIGSASSGDGKTEEMSSAGNVSMLDSLFAVQQIENAYQRTEEAVKQGRLVLDILDELRIEMLSGGVSKEKLQMLRSSANKERGWVMDRKLLDILDDIETRAEVELAKIEMSSNNSQPAA